MGNRFNLIAVFSFPYKDTHTHITNATIAKDSSLKTCVNKNITNINYIVGVRKTSNRMWIVNCEKRSTQQQKVKEELREKARNQQN